VAKQFRVKVWNVREWRRQYGPTHKPLDAPVTETAEELKSEIQQLRKELARVTTQRDIFKKTWAFSPNRRALPNDPKAFQ
jgi:transposase-like protein